MVPPLKSPLFTQQVVKAMQSLYPLELADRAWDNVGLLQENIVASRHALTPPPTPSTVLLTNDLTERVAQEAIVKKASVIVSYHPFIFRGLKSVTLADPQQRILLKLAQNNIAVYSPHTAIDAAPGGMNDWLADMVTDLHGVSATRSIVQPISGPLPNGLTSAGYGRLIEFSQPVPLREIIQAYASRLGGLSHIMIARPKHNSALFMRNARKLLADLPDDVSNDVSPDDITSVAVCAGSGYDVLKDTSADLIVTGEMTHHSALRLTMLGKTVITVFHSNSERKFLKDVLEPQLENALRKEDETARVIVSIEDEDPFEIWDVNNLPSFLK
ncbi:protein NIF3 [Rhypophila decipiens]|uniref:Protein NIF3 n=1 Tax=Rhypophila decipiens TaxID=261697 RepID=A0AAN7BCJ5_9PEZI|nr:protein NIF3 [Rhypophila decipiens]